MKTNVNYSFIPVPRVYEYLDDKCFRFLVYLIDKERYYSSINKIDNKGYFFISNETINKVLGYSTKTINNIVETLYRNKIINVISEGKQGKLITNRYSINYEVINSLNAKIERVDRNEIKSYRGQNSTGENNFGQNSTGRDNNTETNFRNNSTDNFGQNSTVDNNISYKSIKNNIYGPNIGPNIYSYIEGKKDFSPNHIEKSNSKVNCYISEKEIEEYNNSVNSSEAESNFIAESETGKENLKENNIDNSNLDNTTANAESGIKVSVNSNIDNSNKEEKVEESVNSNNVNSNKEEIEESKESVNSNEENTAVLSHSYTLNEESVISTKKTSENGLKQAKTKELEIINKTDNSNNVKPKEEKVETNNLDNSKNVNSNTANAGTEETVYSNIDNSKEVEGNNNRDNFNYVNSDNRTDNSNSVKPVIKEEIEESVNSNEGINSTIAEGDNSTANAVSEFRDKCTNYTIILEGKKMEIDIPVNEFVQSYYNELNNNIYDTKEFDKQRKIFSKMIVDNHLTDTKYDQMCDNLDVRYSRYVQLDKQANKQTDKEEFTNEEVQYIANELLQQCLNFRLTSENNMQDFYNLRNNYNAFIKEYNVPKEGLKMQKKFAELSVVNKKLNTPVSSQSFAV